MKIVKTIISQQIFHEKKNILKYHLIENQEANNMIEVEGKYNTAKVFTEKLDETNLNPFKVDYYIFSAL